MFSLITRYIYLLDHCIFTTFPFLKNPTFQSNVRFLFFTSVIYILYSKRHYIMNNLSSIRNNSTLNRFLPSYNSMDDTILKRGGHIAGLVNDGNTCFMNSVLQSLASSRTLVEFLDEEIVNSQLKDDETEGENEKEVGEEVQVKVQKLNKNKNGGKRKKKLQKQKDQEDLEKTEESTEKDVAFSIALKELLDKLNFKYYRDKPYFKTHSLLKTMSKAPNKNIIMGYDQEDAQEFFQSILSELEKNVKSISPIEKDVKPVPESELPDGALIGQNDLGSVGTVFIPTEQIDPNSILENKDSSKYYTPFRMITPLDGITAERIGCLTCGENGGIRYSISSSLSLNLPNENINSQALKLSNLMQEWIKPEIIEGVECNRCALNAVLEHLQDQLKQLQEKSTGSIPEKLISAVEERISILSKTLSKPVIDDEDYKKYHTENMVRKCSKSKQILISRPPPLLSIHINRSVFDPNTYTIRKNNSRVLFKSRFNLEPWCCDIDEINLDARLPMSKKNNLPQESSEDENIGGEYYAKLHHKFEQEFEDSDEESYENDSDMQLRGRDVSNYDPLHGEIEEDESVDDGAEYIEETDGLGNTIRRRVIEQEQIQKENDIAMESDEDDEDYTEDQEKDDIFDNNDPEGEHIVDTESSDVESDRVSLPAPPRQYTSLSSSTVPASPLTYSLRSVIVHYGTHNYGHYIAFRRYRGCWWRISDESVYIVEEAEVLSTPGVFMLFYEYDYDVETKKMFDDIEFDKEIEIEGFDDEKPDNQKKQEYGNEAVAENDIDNAQM
ncbi:hypothetical protein TPHA_0G00850 [Tetrapisispora phaffii CBS 4417]|uniref:Ubiquitin carboxyl-terminal hydrolase n=1 Tax=Tetrapisispora phaffii (strain ATCC 24235 / CBS 4417 / NBRC 1672 / NRRL Y-8282 / UCD 70-5) TaxID=1071381 RepID=G8BVJ3_TETPH|nr:hypothetical protein TPHA_0G00850 [Tetrapisispora phaffii CBS 4417]CCE63921.1 hypothetical protein TPHA_0G00850 [Tetrapisispora phaffii CBS 4417]